MNKIVKGCIIGLGAWAVMETVFAMGKGYALGVAKCVERNADIDCEELVDLIGDCKLPNTKFIAFMAKAADNYLSERDEKKES